ADEPLSLLRAPGRAQGGHGVRDRDLLAGRGRLVGGPDRGRGRRHGGRLRAAHPVPGRPAVCGRYPPVPRRRPAGRRGERMTTERSIGWLGTGKMGSAMAARLIDAGRPVTVWNRTEAKTAPLAARGARVAPDIAALADCWLVFTMVTGPADLEQVTLGEGGLLAGERR